MCNNVIVFTVTCNRFRLKFCYNSHSDFAVKFKSKYINKRCVCIALNINNELRVLLDPQV